MGEANSIPEHGIQGSPALGRSELVADRLALVLRNGKVSVTMGAAGPIATAPTVLPEAPCGLVPANAHPVTGAIGRNAAVRSSRRGSKCERGHSPAGGAWSTSGAIHQEAAAVVAEPVPPPVEEEVHYPEPDGRCLRGDSLQADAIINLRLALVDHFLHTEGAAVAGNLLVYHE